MKKSRLLTSLEMVILRTASRISPTLNSKLLYLLTLKRPLILHDPIYFNDKMMWLKLNDYINNPLVIQCSDKYAVREYVRSHGYGELLNDLIGVYDSVEDIPWDELPDQFVLKWNFGAGLNVICTDKQNMDKEAVFKIMRRWGKKSYWLNYSEMQYKKIKKRIICEKYLHAIEE